MNDRTDDDAREIPEPVETDTRRATGMGEPGTLPSDEPHEPDTERATGMGEPGTLPSDRDPVRKARDAAGGRLEDVAGRVRRMGDQAAQKNKLLGPTRSVAYNAADGIDHAARYVRTREVDEMRSDLEDTVRRHPLASITVAFFAGYALRRIL